MLVMFCVCTSSSPATRVPATQFLSRQQPFRHTMNHYHYHYHKLCFGQIQSKTILLYLLSVLQLQTLALKYKDHLPPPTLSFRSFGSMSRQIWLDNVRCSGTESRLVSCSRNRYGSHNCDHSKDVAIYCNTPRSILKSVINAYGWKF